MAFYGFNILIDLDDDFLENVKILVSYILSRDMLIPKRIHNKTVTGEDIVKYIKVISKLNYYKYGIYASLLDI